MTSLMMSNGDIFYWNINDFKCALRSFSATGDVKTFIRSEFGLMFRCCPLRPTFLFEFEDDYISYRITDSLMAIRLFTKDSNLWNEKEVDEIFKILIKTALPFKFIKHARKIS